MSYPSSLFSITSTLADSVDGAWSEHEKYNHVSESLARDNQEGPACVVRENPTPRASYLPKTRGKRTIAAISKALKRGRSYLEHGRADFSSVPSSAYEKIDTPSNTIGPNEASSIPFRPKKLWHSLKKCRKTLTTLQLPAQQQQHTFRMWEGGKDGRWVSYPSVLSTFPPDAAEQKYLQRVERGLRGPKQRHGCQVVPSWFVGVVIVTMPVLCMILLGTATKEKVQKQWRKRRENRNTDLKGKDSRKQRKCQKGLPSVASSRH